LGQCGDFGGGAGRYGNVGWEQGTGFNKSDRKETSHAAGADKADLHRPSLLGILRFIPLYEKKTGFMTAGYESF
jgi:hypothetical protein